MASAPEMAALELTADSARALVQSGRLRELIGVAPHASLEEVRGACKRALLKHHPDKGGNPEVFKVIQPAIQREENFYAFEGGVVPPWAKPQLESIAESRQAIQKGREKLNAARVKEEDAGTEASRAKARAEATKHEQGIALEAEILEDQLRFFGKCYVEHLEEEDKRKEREAREAVAREQQRLLDARADRALQRRRERGRSKRFPTLPKAIANKTTVEALTALRREYKCVRKASLKCKHRGRDATDLDSRAASLLQQAHEHVQHWCCVAHMEAGDRSKRFPQLPPNDPRHAEMVKLKQEHTRLKDRIRKAKSEEQRAALQARVDEAEGEAIWLLERIQ